MHFRSIRYLVLVALLIIAGTSALPAQAESYEDWSFVVSSNSNYTSVCNGTNYNFYFTAAWDLPNSGVFQEFTAYRNGNVLWTNNVAQPFSGTGSTPAHLVGTSPGTSFTIAGSWVYSYQGVPFYYSYLSATCDTTTNSFVNVTFSNFPLNIYSAPTPGLPSGFVLRTIVCQMPVYDRPGGQAVPDTLILGGQTWFVNPITEEDDDGQSWSQIFVGSFNIPYIPTDCIR